MLSSPPSPPHHPRLPLSLLLLYQVLHEQIEVPGTGLKLCHLSSRTQGYHTLLKVTMTPAVVSMGLLKVHLMVAVEGHLFQKWFHASPNLAYTYIWDKTDAYGQRVYGLSEAVGEWRWWRRRQVGGGREGGNQFYWGKKRGNLCLVGVFCAKPAGLKK